VGLGNPLSGDDIFGPDVLEQLRQSETRLSPGAIMVDAHTDLLNHIEDFEKYDSVLLIDAVLDPEGLLGKPGGIVVLNEERLQSFSEASQSIHQMSPLLAVKLVRTLHPEAQTRITLIGLIIDRLAAEPCFATAARVAEAAAVIQKMAAPIF
jgi:hydrogenase maturation protease